MELHISSYIRGSLPMEHLQEMKYGESNDYVIEDVTWPVAGGVASGCTFRHYKVILIDKLQSFIVVVTCKSTLKPPAQLR